MSAEYPLCQEANALEAERHVLRYLFIAAKRT
jgi:hypothetical protein